MPTSAVRCTNADCQHYTKVRTVALAEVGPGIFARPSLICECGHIVLPAATRPNPGVPEKAIRNPPERRRRWRR